MGCDIHGFVDYSEPNTDYVQNFGQFNLGRNYTLFSALAGVRTRWGMEEYAGYPNGIPEKRSWMVDFELFLRVSDDGGEKTCSTKNAERFADYNRRLMHQGYKDETKNYVLHPDWHSHSHMDVKELSQALRRYRSACRAEGYDGTTPSCIKALMASMRALEKEGCKNVNFVFWFDN